LKKIKWCLKQKKGIKIIKPNTNLSNSYLKDADETLENLSTVKRKWKVIIGYYACYNALYSILMKAGIQSEIHECSLELMKFLDFRDNSVIFLKDLKEKRIKVQYYLKEIALESEKEVKEFVLECKTILKDLNSEKIEQIRNDIYNHKS